MQSNRRQITVVGAALVAAGTVMAAIGANVEKGEPVLVLTILGAGLVAAGVASILRVSPLSYRQSAISGAVLLVAGTATAVLGGLAQATQVQTVVTPMGGALVVAGLIELVLGASRYRAEPRSG